jgi:hypothetical protein
MSRFFLAAAVVLVIAQVAVFSPRALPSMILAAAALAAVLVVEETRVREARRAEHYAEGHVCHHGGTTFQPSEDDGGQR